MQTEEEFLAYRNLLKLLNDDEKDNKSEENKTEDDKTFRINTKEQITSRDAKYTELLSHFVTITKVRNVLKEIFKWSFYLIVISAIVALIIIVYSLFDKYVTAANIDQMIESLPLLITAMVGFVSTIITIPVTITKYLFSTKEDENITQIILHTQEHDTSGRKWAMDFKKIVENLEETPKDSTEKLKKDNRLAE